MAIITDLYNILYSLTAFNILNLIYIYCLCELICAPQFNLKV